jgi:polysaccharide pyruvyl transferase WcaK-like protein
MMGPRILVVHAWLKGNLGDVLQLSVLLSELRRLNPRALDLAGYPASPAAETGEALSLANRYIPDTFPWYWSLTPGPLARLAVEPWWRRQREALFSRYDALVCAPGPYLAAYDPRAVSALSDIAVAADLGLDVVLSSHSIGPLTTEALATVRKASVCIAREPATHTYLSARGVPSLLSADFAFVYPYAAPSADGPADRPYRVAFLRSNNLVAKQLRSVGGRLYEGARLIADLGSDQLVLATSDYRRDQRFLVAAARALGVSWMACRSVSELVRLIGRSNGVISDRYHPAICAAVLGKPAQVIPNREPHKMAGLTDLIAGRPLDELQGLARAGLAAIRAELQGLS